MLLTENRSLWPREVYFKFGQSRTPQSLCNLTRPEKSLLLQAPLDKSAGGLSRCKSSVFADTTDPDYQAMLTAIRSADSRLAKNKRFDMPGFRPNDYYLLFMRQYGVLPDKIANKPSLDPYQTDREYWRLLDWKP